MKKIKLNGIATLVVLGILFVTTAGWADQPPPGKGTLTITGAIGAGQKDIFTIRKCAYSQYYVQKRTSCTLLPFTLKINQPTLLDAGIYSVHGPHNSVTGSQIMGIVVNDQQEVNVPLKPLEVPFAKSVRFRMFVDISSQYEFHKMALGVWSSAANYPFLKLACEQADAFSRFVCSTWNNPDSLNGGMIQFDQSYNYYFLHQDALRDYGNGFRMVKLGRIYVNDMADTGQSVGVFPGVYGIEYTYPDGSTIDRTGIVVSQTQGSR